MKQALILKRGLAFAALSAMLAACGGHSSVMPQAPKRASSSKITMTVHIPKASTAGARKPAYISASTQSIGLSYYVNGGSQYPEQYANVTPTSPDCSAGSTGTTCTLTFGAVAGDIFYTVKAYDGLNGAGNALGYAQAETTIVANTPNTFSITLGGVVSKIALNLSSSTVAEGTPADVPFTVSLYDADGNLIVNSPSYSSSTGSTDVTATITTPSYDEFSITQNGQAVGGDYSTNTFGVAAPFTGLELHYNGAFKTTGQIAFAISGVTAQAPIAVGSPTSSAGMLYWSWYEPSYGNVSGGSGIVGYPGGASGTEYWSDSLAAQNLDACGSGSLPVFNPVTADRNGDVVWIAPNESSCGTEDIIAQTPGTRTPHWTITGVPAQGTGTTLPTNVVSLGFDKNDTAYLFSDHGSGYDGAVLVDHLGSIDVLQPGATGSFSSAMVARSIDYVNDPEALAVGDDGTVYAAHVGDANTSLEAIEVFAPGAYGNMGSATATPQRYIGGSQSGLDKVVQLALDSQGNLYAANNYANSVTVYGQAANGNVAPDRTIAGSATGINAPSGIGIDAFDNLYVLNGDGTVNVFPPGSSGNVAPARTMTASEAASSGLALIR